MSTTLQFKILSKENLIGKNQSLKLVVYTINMISTAYLSKKASLFFLKNYIFPIYNLQVLTWTTKSELLDFFLFNNTKIIRTKMKINKKTKRPIFSTSMEMFLMTKLNRGFRQKIHLLGWYDRPVVRHTA